MSSKEVVPYKKYEYDLSIARESALLNITGDFIFVEKLDGDANIRIDSIAAEPLDLTIYKALPLSAGFKRLYLTNKAQSGRILRFAIGLGASFIPRESTMAFQDRPWAKDINRLITSQITTGKVICQDDFESTNFLWQSTTGTVGRSTTTGVPLRGEACMKLTTGAVAGDEAVALRRFAFLDNMIIGMEFWLKIVGANIRSLRFEVEGYDGTYAVEGEITYLIDDEKLQYYTDAGLLDVPGGDVELWRVNANAGYVHGKIVVDFAQHKYVYMKLHNKTVDMRALAPRLTASSTKKEWWGGISIATDENAAKDMWVDDVIFTCYETMQP